MLSTVVDRCRPLSTVLSTFWSTTKGVVDRVVARVVVAFRLTHIAIRAKCIQEWCYG